MIKISLPILLLTAHSVICFAASPIASVSGTASLTVNGISIPSRSEVPVSVGDELTTTGGTATLQFRDGSGVTLQANSRAKLSGTTAAPSIRILRGMATYDLAPDAKLRVEDESGTAARLLGESAKMVGAVNQSAAPTVYRSAGARVQGVVMPASAVVSGRFQVNAGGSTPGGASVILPNGTRLNVQLQANNTYVVTSVQVPVTVPGQANPTYIDAPSSVLAGATLNGVTPATSSGSNVQVTLVPQGSSTPLTPVQVSNAIQIAAAAAVNNAIGSGQLPATSAAPSMNPIVTGRFSSSAP